MRFLMPCLLTLALAPALRADDISGPNLATLRKTWWGSVFYDPMALGPHSIETRLEEFRIKTPKGELRFGGSDLNGYTATFAGDSLTIRSIQNDVDIRWQGRTWSLRQTIGGLVLTCPDPKDTVSFQRSNGEYRIKGAQGEVLVTWNLGDLTVKSPLGTSAVITQNGTRTFSGVPLDRIPYLGRGVYLSFHGLGILLDVGRAFPIPETSAWNEWRPLLGKPFDPQVR
jgi:hypothetical protein